MAPGSADSTCAASRPLVTWPERAPSARISADGRLASRTVAQAVKIAFRADSVISMIVITSSICSSRLTTGLVSPLPDAPASWPLTVAWKASTATMPHTVTAMLAVLSRARRGLVPANGLEQDDA